MNWKIENGLKNYCAKTNSDVSCDVYWFLTQSGLFKLGLAH